MCWYFFRLFIYLFFSSSLFTFASVPIDVPFASSFLSLFLSAHLILARLYLLCRWASSLHFSLNSSSFLLFLIFIFPEAFAFFICLFFLWFHFNQNHKKNICLLFFPALMCSVDAVLRKEKFESQSLVVLQACEIHSTREEGLRRRVGENERKSWHEFSREGIRKWKDSGHMHKENLESWETKNHQRGPIEVSTVIQNKDKQHTRASTQKQVKKIVEGLLLLLITEEIRDCCLPEWERKGQVQVADWSIHPTSQPQWEEKRKKRLHNY